VSRIAHALEWCHSARTQVRMRVMTHASLMDLMDKAAEFELGEELELCAWLGERKREVVAWSEAAKEIIDSRQRLDLHSVGGLLEKARNIVVEPGNHQELRDLQQKALDLQTRCDAIAERTECTAFVQRPRYSETRALVAACEDLGRFEPSSLALIRSELAKADAWCADMLKMFAHAVPPGATASLKWLEAALEPTQMCLDRVLELTGSSSSTPQDVDDAFCVCLGFEGGMVLRCLHCGDRYHAECLNIDPKDYDGRPLLCPLCNASAQGARLATLEPYPLLARVERAVDECRSLGLIVQALDPLVTILLDGEKLTSVVRHAIKDKGGAAAPPADEAGRRVPLLRLLARALVGLGVDLRQGLLGDLWDEVQRLAPDAPDPQAVRGAAVARSLEQAAQLRCERAELARNDAKPSAQPDVKPNSEPELMKLYREELEDLLLAIANPPAAEAERGQGLMVAADAFKPNEENCVCNLRGVDLEAPIIANAPAIQCDTCHEFFHISCAQVPVAAARVIRWHQMRRTLDAEIDAEVPASPDSYMCPGCCLKADAMYAYGEVVLE
ncbi:hypothetical protein IWQ56_004861, partial [Coemansia nantahalensis]